MLHAICDALLGAASLGDIGKHFPATNPEFKDIASASLLENVVREVEKKLYTVGNVDSTIVLERPELAKYINAMQGNISKLLKIPINNVSIKATTNEGMGLIGRGEGIAAFAVVTLKQGRTLGRKIAIAIGVIVFHSNATFVLRITKLKFRRTVVQSKNYLQPDWTII